MCGGVDIPLTNLYSSLRKVSLHRVAWLLWKGLGPPHAVLVRRTPASCYATGNAVDKWSSLRVQFDSVPKEESSGFVCSDECVACDNTVEVSEHCDFIVNSTLWSEGTKRHVPQLPWLSLQQAQHKSRFKELHTNFSELTTCIYFHVTSLKVFFLSERLRGQMMGIPPEFWNWWLYPVDTRSLIYATLNDSGWVGLVNYLGNWNLSYLQYDCNKLLNYGASSFSVKWVGCIPTS